MVSISDISNTAHIFTEFHLRFLLALAVDRADEDVQRFRNRSVTAYLRRRAAGLASVLPKRLNRLAPIGIARKGREGPLSTDRSASGV